MSLRYARAPAAATKSLRTSWPFGQAGPESKTGASYSARCAPENYGDECKDYSAPAPRNQRSDGSVERHKRYEMETDTNIRKPMETRIEELEQQLDQLHQRAAQNSQEAAVRLRSRMTSLRHRLAETRKRLRAK